MTRLLRFFSGKWRQKKMAEKDVEKNDENKMAILGFSPPYVKRP